MSTLYSVTNIIILDSEGGRICCKYYSKDFPTLKEQKVFEKKIFSKTQATKDEIILLENLISVINKTNDLTFIVSGRIDENELILSSALETLVASLNSLLNNEVDKRNIMENLQTLFVVVDELIDNGIIMENEPQVIVNRIQALNKDQTKAITEQQVRNVLKEAKKKFQGITF